MKHLYLILSLLLINITLFAQTGTIKGKVTTSDGEPTPYVTIGLKDVKKGTFTTEEGTYVIKNVKPGNYILVISHTGTRTQEQPVVVTADHTTTANATLEVSASQLNEVVVGGAHATDINSRRVSIGKLQVASMDLPQSVTVISHEVLENQQAQRLSDVVKNVNGVYMASSRGGVQESFNSRGYAFSSTNMFKNGMRVNSGAMPEMSGLERVEVLKGSAAILYGNVSPGAVMNMVTKQPKFNFGGEVNLRAGSFGLLKPAFDVYGPLSKSVAYRVNGSFETTDSYRDQVHSKRYYVNPSLLFKLSDRTELVVQGDYLKADFTPDFGTPSLNSTTIPKMGRNTFFGEPWNYTHTQQSTASANIKHQISKTWNLNGLVSYSKYVRDYYGIERLQAGTSAKTGLDTLARMLGKNGTNEDYFAAELDFTGTVKTGILEHNILAGIDGDRYVTGAYKYNVSTKPYDTILDIHNPATSRLRTDMPDAPILNVAIAPINRIGIYLQDLIKINDKLNILVGVRASYLQTENSVTYDFTKGGQKTTANNSRYDHAISPKVAFIYKLRPATAVFASYTTSFTPNTGFDISGGNLAPSTIQQYEAGIKNDFFGGKLSTNLTVYSIINNNYAQTAPTLADGSSNTNTSYKQMVGGTKSQGVELDIMGHPIAGLDVVAGYSYNNIEITASGDKLGSVKGERLVGNPNHTANASAFYTIQKSTLKGLKFGAGFYYLGQRYAGWNNTTDIKGQPTANRLISVPGYSTIDISAGYTYKKLSFMAKVSNLTNTYNYYVHENYSINPIPPTAFTGTVAYKF
ncbi:TonB-dependent receptor [Chitinophaga sp. Cy-1792]|uniref:TonB-dependent receptor n=1 Tax=Chitinophaga sp. Cy-1792 TaxID=2608339 RepID=UPI001423E52F|nr:TonB-dependent receptor [Chitinophaga sp. Cy-1792]NIG54097.1 TonB-dependent receptor [Chitinophaga sp. Cy-1792]